MKKSLIARLVALGSAAVITFTMVSLMADYGLPQADGAVQLAIASHSSNQ